MSKMRKSRLSLKLKNKRTKEHDRLSQSSFPQDLAQAFEACSKAPNDENFHDLTIELLRFKDVDAAYRSSNKYYFSALAKVYEVWLKISLWDEYYRKEFLKNLDDANKKTITSKRSLRGGDLHIILRYLIHSAGESKSEQNRRSRDASALRQAARENWTVEDFNARANKGDVKLDQLHRKDAEFRRSNRQHKEKILNSTIINDVVEISDDDVSVVNGRIVWKGISKESLFKSTQIAHDVVFVARIDPHEKKIIIREAHLTEYSSLSDEKLKEITETLVGAGHIKSARAGRRVRNKRT